MSNSVFPTLVGLEWGIEWEPEFFNRMQKAVSGKEYRANLGASPVYRLKLSYEFLKGGTQTDLRTLMGFFLERKGSFDSFLYLHPDDNAVTDQLIGVANGSKLQFQLVRSFGSAFVEPVCNVITVTNIKVNGVTKTSGVDYTVSATGMVIFASAPVSGNITWTGRYYYKARFMQDNMAFSKFMKDLFSAKKVELNASLGTKI
jgi:uncharacterized protein (TIGR02217 family)